MKQTTSKDGTQIGYWRSGAGQPLLLVHGTTADHRRWSTISPHLEAHFTLYTMDRRGRGRSTDSPDYNIFREAEDVAAVVNAIGGTVFVLGHSYGGLCSLEAALLSDNISRLILYEPPVPNIVPPSAPGVLDRIQSLASSGQKEAGLEVFMREVVHMPEHELKEYRQLPMWQGRIALATTIARELREVEQHYQFQPEKFSKVRVPTLLLLGGDSPPFFKTAIKSVQDALINSRIAVMPGQQHIAMDTNPELFAREVKQFLLE